MTGRAAGTIPIARFCRQSCDEFGLTVESKSAIVDGDMARAKHSSRQLRARDQSVDLVMGARSGWGVEVRPEARPSREIRRKTRINSRPATLFALLTNAQRMMSWLARDVNADPRPGGIFRLADFSGLWVEGAYLKVISHRTVVFSWGGIEGLKIGQSTVEFNLQRDSNGTLVRLRHFGLTDAAATVHRVCWSNFGLPKLKAAAEGREPGATCLSEVADWHEQHPYSERNVCERRASQAGGR